jgi:hypothetical protein
MSLVRVGDGFVERQYSFGVRSVSGPILRFVSYAGRVRTGRYRAERAAVAPSPLGSLRRLPVE